MEHIQLHPTWNRFNYTLHGIDTTIPYMEKIQLYPKWNRFNYTLHGTDSTIPYMEQIQLYPTMAHMEKIPLYPTWNRFNYTLHGTDSIICTLHKEIKLQYVYPILATDSTIPYIQCCRFNCTLHIHYTDSSLFYSLPKQIQLYPTWNRFNSLPHGLSRCWRKKSC